MEPTGEKPKEPSIAHQPQKVLMFLYRGETNARIPTRLLDQSELTEEEKGKLKPEDLQKIRLDGFFARKIKPRKPEQEEQYGQVLPLNQRERLSACALLRLPPSEDAIKGIQEQEQIRIRKDREILIAEGKIKPKPIK